MCSNVNYDSPEERPWKQNAQKSEDLVTHGQLKNLKLLVLEGGKVRISIPRGGEAPNHVGEVVDVTELSQHQHDPNKGQQNHKGSKGPAKDRISLSLILPYSSILHHVHSIFTIGECITAQPDSLEMNPIEVTSENLCLAW